MKLFSNLKVIKENYFSYLLSLLPISFIAGNILSLTFSKWSIKSNATFLGIISSPIPSVVYGYISFLSKTPVSWYFLNTEPYVSIPQIFIFGFFSLRNFATPDIVPPVPTPTTKWVIFPSVWFHISGPVSS